MKQRWPVHPLKLDPPHLLWLASMLTWMLRLNNHPCALDQTLALPIRAVSLIFARKFTLPLVLHPDTTEGCLHVRRE